MVQLSKTSIDFDDIVTELESDLQNRDTFKALFPGETSRVFTEHGAGITALMLFHIHSAVQNSFMPTAFSKSAVYAIATSLGQPPSRKNGANLSIRVTVNNTLASPVNLPKFSRFSARGLEWYTTEDNLIPAGASGQTITVNLRQGERITENFTSNGKSFQRIEVGEDFSIDNQFLEVSVDTLDYTNNGSSLLAANAGDTVFAEQVTSDGTVLILFGNVLFGTIPPVGSDIEIRYSLTIGANSNSSITGDNFSYLEIFPLGGGEFLNLAGVSITTASGGSDEASIEVVKNTSPRLFAANNRAVRRNDYEAFILKHTGAAAAKAFGEYEEAQLKGFASNIMMNRAFISAVPNGVALQDTLAIITGNGVDTVFNVNIGSTNLIPGSVLLNSSIKFDDRDGRGILTSPNVSFNLLSGGTASASNGSGTSGQAFDGNTLTSWSAGVIPVFSSPVRLAYDMGAGNEKVFKAIRIKSSNELGSTIDSRAFPSKVRILGSTLASPSLSVNSTDWDVIRGFVDLEEPGVGSFSRWIPLDNPINPEVLSNPTPVAYRHLAIDIIDRYGTQSTVKIAEVEAMDDTGISTIDYETGDVTLKVGTPIASGEEVNANYAVSNLDQAQKQDLINFLNGTPTTPALNHFTTIIHYRNSVARRVTVSMNVYHLRGFDPASVLNAVQTALDDLFKIGTDSLGKPIFLADIYETVQAVNGVDYIILSAPTLDLSFDFNEFPLLVEKNIGILATGR